MSKLKDTDVPKLEFDKTSRAAAFETWLQRAALRIGGLHRKLETFWLAVQMATAAAYDQYLSLGAHRQAHGEGRQQLDHG